MTTLFPGAKDTYTNPTATSPRNSPSLAGEITDKNDAILAIETKVGINGSSDNTSFDYKLQEVVTGQIAVSKTATQTLTNKTLTSPVITDKSSTGTDAGVETLNNKTLTTPKIVTSIFDANGNEVIKTPATASAVNEITVTNAATNTDPSITATGGDTNINLAIAPKGTGVLKLGAGALKFPNADGLANQVMATDGSGKINFVTPIAGSSPFSPGTDGLVTLDGVNTYAFFTLGGSTYTLTRDIFVSALTVNNGIILIENGYAIYSATSIINAGTIHNNGSAGTDAVTTTIGTGGAGGGGGTFTAGTTGSNGGSVNGTAKTCLGSGGSKGGNAYNSGTVAGGTAGTATAETVLMKPLVNSVNLTAGSEDSVTELYRLIASTNGKSLSTSAGSGGGASGNAAGTVRAGGGAGGTGGVVFLVSPTITNTGTIASNGGNGGAGANGGNPGGGGGGGAGGTIFLIYKSLTAGTITAAGGTKGATTNGETPADDGVAGKIYKLKITDTVIA